MLICCAGFGETQITAHQCAVDGVFLSRSDHNMTRAYVASKAWDGVLSHAGCLANETQQE